MGSLLPNLHKLLGYEYKLQTGMKQQLKFITRELEIIDAFLHKVSDVPWYQLDAQTKAWAREAREVSYEMEDVLDTFLVHFQDREPANPSRLRRAMKNMASLFSKGKARRHITSAIQDIKNRLQNLADQRARYRVDDIMVNHPATTLTVDPRLQAMYKEVANLVGIDKPRDYIISKLSLYGDDMACSRKIVSISGTGGIGKTTLAKAVYDNLRAYFPRGAFVPVGRNPNMAKLLMDILYDLDNINYADVHSFKNRDERQLIDSLREILKDKRYFIVMDDLWDTRSWDETIKLALLENNRGSRIIITTRNSQVATKIGDEVYKMQPLSKDNSKKLFYTRVFGAKYKWPDNKPDEISNKILKKCDGVPLAIITMASLLVGKPREKWSDVFTSVGFGHKDETEVDNTMKILSFSYYDMPAHLRTCLLYLNVFPEDYTIDKGCLIWRWIAESIIQGKPGIQLFELGEQYFNDLVNRSMVQAIDMESEGRVQGCRVHDMVLDLIVPYHLKKTLSQYWIMMKSQCYPDQAVHAGWIGKLTSLEELQIMIHIDLLDSGQFQCNKENSNLSLHIWDGTDAMPFGSSKKDCSLAPYAMMPNVEVLESQIYVRALKDGNGDCSNTGLQYLPSLQIFNVHLNCEGVTDAEVDETVAALRKTTEAHPNHPTLRLDRWGLHKMICPG
ncbi:hypothetical protein PR202_ga22612 [Eleusine coracana subsp. coracana]|uniref:NB-ARC domain-containing protein n=1 Tax=Eleusine coracana subsp. coracana TaxID=191504 RepID=A0AAV5D4C9_ELECO|nr:hypothetical protein PR202_ga22612 [Eleusine coracana subsp. coracana]